MILLGFSYIVQVLGEDSMRVRYFGEVFMDLSRFSVDLHTHVLLYSCSFQDIAIICRNAPYLFSAPTNKKSFAPA